MDSAARAANPQLFTAAGHSPCHFPRGLEPGFLGAVRLQDRRAGQVPFFYRCAGNFRAVQQACPASGSPRLPALYHGSVCPTALFLASGDGRRPVHGCRRTARFFSVPQAIFRRQGGGGRRCPGGPGSGRRLFSGLRYAAGRLHGGPKTAGWSGASLVQRGHPFFWAHGKPELCRPAPDVPGPPHGGLSARCGLRGGQPMGSGHPGQRHPALRGK